MINLDKLSELLARAQAGEDLDDLMEEAKHDADVQAAQDRVDAAFERLADSVGNENDSDDTIDQYADDLIHARNMHLKVCDPDSYNERRQMGLL